VRRRAPPEGIEDTTCGRSLLAAASSITLTRSRRTSDNRGTENTRTPTPPHTGHPTDADAEKNRQRDAWITVQRGHAVANGLPLLACNRTGFEASPDGGRGIEFWGSSFVAGPQGEFLAIASTDTRELLVADVDLARSENVRRIWPFLRDRRIDAYDDLLRRFRD